MVHHVKKALLAVCIFMDFYGFCCLLEGGGPGLFRTSVRSGDTLHVLVAGSESELERMLDVKVRKLLRPNGDMVTYSDGRSVWIIDEEEYPYVWHADGDRVRARRVRYERDRDGVVSGSFMKHVWVRP